MLLFVASLLFASSFIAHRIFDVYIYLFVLLSRGKRLNQQFGPIKTNYENSAENWIREYIWTATYWMAGNIDSQQQSKYTLASTVSTNAKCFYAKATSSNRQAQLILVLVFFTMFSIGYALYRSWSNRSEMCECSIQNAVDVSRAEKKITNIFSSIFKCKLTCQWCVLNYFFVSPFRHSTCLVDELQSSNQ